MKFEPFAWFMDYIVYPIMWCLSPGVREHARYVKVQNLHLRNIIHTTPDLNCWYCRAREESRDIMRKFPES